MEKICRQPMFLMELWTLLLLLHSLCCCNLHPRNMSTRKLMLRHFSILQWQVSKVYTWEDNIKMYLKKIVWEIVDWSHLSQDGNQWWAFVNTVVNIFVP
jgi:hypothetical protein